MGGPLLQQRLLVASVLWASINFVALYGTVLVLWASPWVQGALASGWLLTVAAGILTGAGRRTEATRPKSNYLELFAKIAVHVFVAGLLILVSLLVHVLIDKPPDYWATRTDPTAWPTQQVPKIADPTTHGRGSPMMSSEERYRGPTAT